MFTISEGQLQEWVSEARLRRYLDHSCDTVKLYMYNGHLAANMSEIILHVEVLVRNVMHDRLSMKEVGRPVPWYLDRDKYDFDKQTFSALQKAASRAGQLTTEPGKVVAEITFGTWCHLLDSRYQTTVWPVVAPGFSGKKRSERNREELANAMKFLHSARNRCSHAEPVYGIDLDLFIENVDIVASYVSHDAALWLNELWAELRRGTIFK